MFADIVQKNSYTVIGEHKITRCLIKSLIAVEKFLPDLFDGFLAET